MLKIEDHKICITFTYEYPKEADLTGNKYYLLSSGIGLSRCWAYSLQSPFPLNGQKWTDWLLPMQGKHHYKTFNMIWSNHQNTESNGVTTPVIDWDRSQCPFTPSGNENFNNWEPPVSPVWSKSTSSNRTGLLHCKLWRSSFRMYHITICLTAYAVYFPWRCSTSLFVHGSI